MYQVTIRRATDGAVLASELYHTAEEAARARWLAGMAAMDVDGSWEIELTRPDGSESLDLYANGEPVVS